MARKKVKVKAKVLAKTLPDGTVDTEFYKPVFKEDQEFSVCMDLKARIDTRNKFMAGMMELSPGQVIKVPTGVFLELPPGWEAVVRPRSGLAAEHGITVVNSPGTIDTGYRGEITILLTKMQAMSVSNGYTTISNSPFIVNDGDRIAQLAIREVPTVTVEFVDELSETDRGDKGFGSTGTR